MTMEYFALAKAWHRHRFGCGIPRPRCPLKIGSGRDESFSPYRYFPARRRCQRVVDLLAAQGRPAVQTGEKVLRRDWLRSATNATAPTRASAAIPVPNPNPILLNGARDPAFIDLSLQFYTPAGYAASIESLPNAAQILATSPSSSTRARSRRCPRPAISPKAPGAGAGAGAEAAEPPITAACGGTRRPIRKAAGGSTSRTRATGSSPPGTPTT